MVFKSFLRYNTYNGTQIIWDPNKYINIIICSFTEENVSEILEREVGNTFTRVLEDAGVYKCTDEGLAAFLRFVNTVF